MTVLAITPNPALDRILSVPHFTAGAVNRAASRQLSPGGKGINVARAARQLGAEAISVGWLAGSTGRTLAELTEREGLSAHWTWLEGVETRMTTVVIDDGRMTVINEPGDPINPGDWRRFVSEVHREVSRCEALCVCGSFPPGVTADQVGAMLQLFAVGTAPVWLDSSGANLKAGLGVKRIHLKINGDELSAALHLPIEDADSARIAAEAARDYTGGAVVVTLGAKGAIMVSEVGVFAAVPPDVQVINPIGSGDSALAALAIHGATADGLRAAVAAGTANALTPSGGGHFSRDLYDEIYAQTQVSAL